MRRANGRPLMANLERRAAHRTVLGSHPAGTAGDGGGSRADGRAVTAFAPSRLKAVRASRKISPAFAKYAPLSVIAIRFYVDANGAYPADKALDYARAIADAGAVLLEDPCPLSPDACFRKLRQDSPIPHSRRFRLHVGCAMRIYLSNSGAQALSIKPGRFGLTHSRVMLDIVCQERR